MYFRRYISECTKQKRQLYAVYYAVRDAPASLRSTRVAFPLLQRSIIRSFRVLCFRDIPGIPVIRLQLQDIASYCRIINSATSLDLHTCLYALIIPRVSRPLSCSDFSITSCMKNFTCCYFKMHTNWRSDLCRINRMHRI